MFDVNLHISFLQGVEKKRHPILKIGASGGEKAMSFQLYRRMMSAIAGWRNILASVLESTEYVLKNNFVVCSSIESGGEQSAGTTYCYNWYFLSIGLELVEAEAAVARP